MKKHFYSHLIETETLTIELNKLEITEEEKAHLLTIVDSSLHHTVLDAILSELSSNDKKLFLQHIAVDDHEEIWNFLNRKVDTIEEKIKKTAEDLKKELHDDIKEVHEIKGKE
jgi:hypothetical protein